jgi:hypothetical protein
MRNFLLLCLLIAASTWGQANPGSPQSATQPDGQVAASSVAADAPVLTVKGFCPDNSTGPDSSSSKTPCQTIVTREQFEKLVGAIEPTADAATRKQIGRGYPQFLIMADEAQRRGLDKDPNVQQQIAFGRLQILSRALTRQIQHEAAQVPEKDIEDWYQAHLIDFEQANLERLVVPNTRQQGKTASASQAAAKSDSDPEAIMHEAEKLRARAAAGEDFVKLQAEAYEFAGVAGNDRPSPKLPAMRRRGLPPAHTAVFDLNPGEVSQVISDTTGHYVYKMDSKQAQPLQAVRPEIVSVLRRQRVKEMMESVQKPFAIDVNSTYFGAASSEPED